MHATLTRKGQITLPKSLREQLHLQPGDTIEFIIGEQGEIKLLPVTSPITKLKGILPTPKKILTLDDMQDAIADGAISL
jgi:AbrB family looped-hinge helix DNA binding protein